MALVTTASLKQNCVPACTALVRCFFLLLFIFILSCEHRRTCFTNHNFITLMSGVGGSDKSKLSQNTLTAVTHLNWINLLDMFILKCLHLYWLCFEYETINTVRYKNTQCAKNYYLLFFNVVSLNSYHSFLRLICANYDHHRIRRGSWNTSSYSPSACNMILLKMSSAFKSFSLSLKENASNYKSQKYFFIFK